MKKEELQRVIDNIRPDIGMQERLMSKIQKPQKRRYVNKMVACFSIVFVISFSLLYIMPMFEKQADRKISIANPDKNASSVKPVAKNSFSVMAYASERKTSDSSVKQPVEVSDKETVELMNNYSVSLPKVKIKRGKEMYYEPGGPFPRGYEAYYDSNTFLKVDGKNIYSIKYTTANEIFSIYDDGAYRYSVDNGMFYEAAFDLNKYDSNGYTADDVERLWNNGQLDDIKKKYFNGKNVQFKDYLIYTDYKTSERTFRVNEEIITIPANHVSVTFTNVEKLMSFVQNTKEYTLYPKDNPGKYDNDIYFSWCPDKACEELTKYKPIKYEDLPGDTITITVTFKDGEVQTKTINTSWDSSGTLVLNLKDN